MWSDRVLPALLLLGLATVLGSCGAREPYVYEPGEFNRELRTFNKDPEDRTSVSICYNRRTTTPEALIEMAQAECGKYNKTAVFNRHGVTLICPFATPAQAIFFCEKT